MASLSTTICLQAAHGRGCWVAGPSGEVDLRGWCHGFTNDGKAILEDLNGFVQLVCAERVRFNEREVDEVPDVHDVPGSLRSCDGDAFYVLQAEHRFPPEVVQCIHDVWELCFNSKGRQAPPLIILDSACELRRGAMPSDSAPQPIEVKRRDA